MSNKSVDINCIKERLLPSILISEKVKLEKRGGYFYGICPFHKEKTASFTVNDHNRFFYCFGCGAHGDVFSFLMQIEGLTFNEALLELAEKAGIKIEQSSAEVLNADNIVLNSTNKWFVANLHKYQDAYKYIKGRIDEDSVIEKFGIGFAPKGGLVKHLMSEGIGLGKIQELGLVNRNNQDYFYNRIMFPIKNYSGQVIAFGGRVIFDSKPKYLNSPESYIFKKSEVLYGLDLALKSVRLSKKIIVVEGYMDVAVLHKFGFTNAVAPLGTAITVNHLQMLLNITHNIVFCFDGDNAGYNAYIRLVKIILPLVRVESSIKFCFLPRGMDPDDMLHRSGAESFERYLSEALILSEFIWDSELNDMQLNVPEVRAKLEKTLVSYCNNVQDRALKRHYKVFFDQKLKMKVKEFLYKKNSGYRRKNSLEVSSDEQYLIMEIVLSYPEILSDPIVEEQFVMFNLRDLASLKESIVGVFGSLELTKDSLEKYLKDCGYSDSIAVVKTRAVNYMISNYQDATSMWNKICAISEVEVLEKEYAECIKMAVEDEKYLERSNSLLKIIWDLKNKIRHHKVVD